MTSEIKRSEFLRNIDISLLYVVDTIELESFLEAMRLSSRLVRSLNEHDPALIENLFERRRYVRTRNNAYRIHARLLYERAQKVYVEQRGHGDQRIPSRLLEEAIVYARLTRMRNLPRLRRLYKEITSAFQEPLLVS